MSDVTVATRVRRVMLVPASPIDLAVLRVAVFLSLVLQTLVWQGPPSWFAGLPEELRVPVSGWTAVGGIPFVSPAAAAVLEAFFVVACVLAAMGWRTRWSTISATLLGVYLLGLPQSFGKLNHYHHLLWIAALLAASPCGDALSIDRLRLGRSRNAFDAAYGLPLRMSWILIGLVYLFPGLWKLVSSPLGWLSGRDLVGHVYAKWHELGGLPPLRIESWTALSRVLGPFTLAFEIGFLPLVLLRRTRVLAVAAGLTFHLGTTLAMRISFLPLVACYVAFVPWSKLVARWHRNPPTANRDESHPPSLSHRPSLVVGTLVVVGTCVAGVLGHDGWPFAVYPRFHYRPPEIVAALRAERQPPDGTPAPVENRGFVDRLHSSRWSFIAQSLAVPASPNERNARILAVSRLYLEQGLAPQLQPCETFFLYLDFDSTDPVTRHENPLRRQLLNAVRRGRPGECPGANVARSGELETTASQP